MSNKANNKILVPIALGVLMLGLASFVTYKILNRNKGTDVAEVTEEELAYDVSIDEREEKEREESKLDLYRKRGKSSDEVGQVNSEHFYNLEGDLYQEYDTDRNGEFIEDTTTTVKAAIRGTIEPEEPDPKVVTKTVYVTKVVEKPTPQPEPEEEQITVAPTPQPEQNRSRSRSRGNNLGSLTSSSSGVTNKEKKDFIYCHIDNDNKKVKNGSDVRLLITERSYIGGYAIKPGTPIHGRASIKGDRVEIKITQLFYNNTYLKVNYMVYDMDGQAGVKVNLDNTDIKEDIRNNSAPNVNVAVPLIGTISTQNTQQKVKEVSVVLIDKHQVFIK
jgi:hypothetical protein